MSCTIRVAKNGVITIPPELMRKYGIKEGTKIKLVEHGECILMIPIPSLEDLWGIDREHTPIIIEAIKELESEHRTAKCSRESRNQNREVSPNR